MQRVSLLHWHDTLQAVRSLQPGWCRRWWTTSTTISLSGLGGETRAHCRFAGQAYADASLRCPDICLCSLSVPTW